MEHSGQYGVIDGIAAVRQWTIEEGYTDVVSVHSGTKHGTNRNRGVFDWTGSYTAYGSVPHAMPGEYIAIELYKAPDDTGDLDNGDIFSGSVLVESAAITWNFATNELISHVVNFGGNGAMAITQDVQLVDVAAIVEKTPCAGKIATFVTGTPDVTTKIEYVTQAVLTFTREVKTAINSGDSAGGSCITRRYPGSAIDWTLALTMEEGNEVSALASGTIHNFRCFHDATQFWDLKWGLVGKRSGITVNPETGDLITQTLNIAMKGFNPAAGNITKPGAGSAWWPAA